MYVCVCVCLFKSLNVCAHKLLYVCVMVIHIILIAQGSGQSFISVLHLRVLFLRWLLVLNITHLDAQCVQLPLLPCLLRPYYHANNIQQIIQHVHLHESSSERPNSTYRIRDDLIYSGVSLIPQEPKSWAEGRRIGEEGFFNIPNMCV